MTIHPNVNCSNGIVSLGTTSGLTFLSGGNGTSSMTFRGSLGLVNTALDGMSFTSPYNYSGPAQIKIDVDDLGNNGVGGPKTASAIAPITVSAVNEVAVIGAPSSPSTTEDTALTFSTANTNVISIKDDAADSIVQLQLSVVNGTLTLHAGSAGLTFTAGGDGTATMTVQGILNDINFALDGLTYQPNPNYNETAGAETLTITYDDLGNTPPGTVATPPLAVAIQVYAVNDPPAFTSGGDVTVLESSGTTTIAGWATNILPYPGTIQGNGTDFARELQVGDLIWAAGQTRIVSAVISSTVFDTANGDYSPVLTAGTAYRFKRGGTGTISSAGTTITGVGTSFLSELQVNDTIYAAGQNRKVVAPLNSNGQFLTATAFNPPLAAGTPFEYERNGAGTIQSALLATDEQVAGQTVTFVVSNDNPSLFVFNQGPSINPVNGNLTFTVATDAVGTANVTVVARDDGGTARGGTDQSSQTFKIVIRAVNAQPTANAMTVPTSKDTPVAFVLTGADNDPNVVQTLTFAREKPGTGTIAANGTSVIGAGTSFTAEFQVGDPIRVLGQGQVVTGVATATSLTTYGSFGPALPLGTAFTLERICTGTISSSGTTVTGAATNFTAELVGGANPDIIWAAGQSRIVSVIGGNGSLTTTTAFSPVLPAGTVFTRERKGSGTISSVGAVVTGVATSFSSEVTVYDAIRPYVETGITVATIGDNLTLTVSGSGFTTAVPPGSAFVVPSRPENGTISAFNAATGEVTYTPDTGFTGTDTLMFTVTDDHTAGAPARLTSAAATVTLTIGVNDPPSFTKGPNQTALEDAALQIVPNWATNILPYPALPAPPQLDERLQTVSFIVSNNNNALFTTQPSVSSTGTLQYMPAPNAYGSATVNVTAYDNGGRANGGNDMSAPQTFVITIVPVNDKPKFTVGGNQTVTEDVDPGTRAGTGTITNVGTGTTVRGTNTYFLSELRVGDVVRAGTQARAVTAINSNTELVTAAAFSPELAAATTFTYDATTVLVADWATGILTGPGQENVDQTVTFQVTTNNDALFAVLPAVTVSRTDRTRAHLTYRPAPNANGSATVTVTAKDSGGVTDGGVDTSAAKTFVITVDAVNDPPSFVMPAELTVPSSTSGVTVANFLSNILVYPGTMIGSGTMFKDELVHADSDPDSKYETFTITALTQSRVVTVVNNQFTLDSADGPFNPPINTPASFAYGRPIHGTISSAGTAVTGVGTNFQADLRMGDTIKAAGQNRIVAVITSDTQLTTTAAFSPVLPALTACEFIRAGTGTIASAPSALDEQISQFLGSFTVTADNGALFQPAGPPTISNTGDLSFILSGLTGSTIVTVSASDSGGVTNNGMDTSTKTFVLTVTPVNVKPTATEQNAEAYEGQSTIIQLAGEDQNPEVDQILAYAYDKAGDGTISSAGTTVTGVGTLFMAQVMVGDIIVAGGQEKSVTVKTNDTLLTVASAFAPSLGGNTNYAIRRPGAGTISSVGTAVTGVLTTFTTQVQVGDIIYVAAPAADPNKQHFQMGIVATRTSDTQLTTTVAFAPALAAGTTYIICPKPTFGMITQFNKATGQVSYTPNPGANGNDVFAFTVMDDAQAGPPPYLVSDPALVRLTINPVNDPPSFTLNLPGGLYTTNEYTAVGPAIQINNVLINILPYSPAAPAQADEAGQTITWSVSDVTNGGALEATPTIVNGPGPNSVSLVFMPRVGYSTPTPADEVVVTMRATDDGPTGGLYDNPVSEMNVTIHLTPLNNVPTAIAPAVQPSTLENQFVDIVLEANDGDYPEQQAVTFTVTVLPTHGTLTLTNGNPLPANIPGIPKPSDTARAQCTVRYTPNPGYANDTLPPPDSFTFTVTDDATAGGPAQTSAPVTVDITVFGVNDPPSFTLAANATVIEDSVAATVNNFATNILPYPAPAGSQPDEAAQTITFNITNNSNPALFDTALGGVAPAIDGAGVLTFTPALHTSGTATITVVAQDDGGTANGGVDTSAAQTFTITVTQVNNAPTAIPPATLPVTAGENMTTVITLTGDDNDLPEDQVLTFAISTAPLHGTLAAPVRVSNTSVTVAYTPTANYVGPDSFDFTVTDDALAGLTANLTSAPATVTIDVIFINQDPVATNMAITTNENVPVNGTLTATDAESEPLTFEIVTNGLRGDVVITNTATGAFTYTPRLNDNGVDTFTFRAMDTVWSNTATVTVTINAVNNPPVVTNPYRPTGVQENVAFTIDLSAACTSGDLASEAQVLTYSGVTVGQKTAHGTITSFDAATGLVGYMPDPDYYSDPADPATWDSFTFTVTDDNKAGAPANLSSAGTVQIMIAHVNQAPRNLGPTTVGTALNTPVTITFTATDIDSTTITFQWGTLPAHGTLTGPAATPTYTPAPGFSGTDSFTFVAVDDQGARSAPCTVTITVVPPPQFDSAPTIAPNPVTAGQPVTFQATAGGASITWNFGDGTTAAGTTATHTYAQPGVYTVTVTATGVLTTTFTTQVFVGMGADGAPVLNDPNINGILVGGPGLGAKSGGSLKLAANYLKRDKTSIQGSVGKLNFPATLTQAQLTGQGGMLTIGKGALAQTFVFTLDKKGKFKATSLPGLEVNLKKRLFRFKANARPGLTDYIESLGGWQRGVKKGPILTMYVPVTLQVDSLVYVAATFQVRYQQSKDTGKGTLAK